MVFLYIEPNTIDLNRFSFMIMKWSKEEIEFLKDNYPDKGIDYCSEKLGRSKRSISHKRTEYGLRLSENKKSEIQKKNVMRRDFTIFENFKVNPKHFITVKEPEMSYILGLLWADGYILYKGIGKSNRVYIECVKEDADVFEEYFNKFGEWYISERHRPNRRISKSIQTNNRVLVEYLNQNGYDKKSYECPHKIMDRIPNELLKYFFRGLIDGDGCFHVNKKWSNYQFSIASTFEQNWEYIENLFSRLDIENYKIQRREHKRSKSSCVRITNRKDITKLGNYIYDGYEEDNIGLKRKYEKYLLIKK